MAQASPGSSASCASRRSQAGLGQACPETSAARVKRVWVERVWVKRVLRQARIGSNASGWVKRVWVKHGLGQARPGSSSAGTGAFLDQARAGSSAFLGKARVDGNALWCHSVLLKSLSIPLRCPECVHLGHPLVCGSSLRWACTEQTTVVCELKVQRILGSRGVYT